MNPRRLLVPFALMLILNPSAAHAQSILDRVVGANGERPLVITELTGRTIGQLARAASVPIGLEAASTASVSTWTVTATGRTLRQVADDIVAADSRFDWREDSGVLVFRPRVAWEGSAGALDAPIGGLKFENIDSADALQLIGRFFNVPGPPSQGPGDTRRFSIDIPAGSTRLHALNEIVRAHGALGWTFESTGGGRAAFRDFPFTVSLYIGDSGVGLGIPRDADVGLPSSRSSPPRSRPAAGDPTPLLDHIVGPLRDGQPLRVNGISGHSLSKLAAAAGVPMGVQMLPPGLPAVAYPGFEGYVVTGMPLRVALELLGGLDARYQWREMGGVVVFRPVTAWDDPNDSLFRLVSSVQLHDVQTTKAIDVLLSRLGAAEGSHSVRDTRVVSVDVPEGTVLDLLNAVVHAHGELSWEWTELGAVEQRKTGKRHNLTCYEFAGSGLGWMLP